MIEERYDGNKNYNILTFDPPISSLLITYYRAASWFVKQNPSIFQSFLAAKPSPCGGLNTRDAPPMTAEGGSRTHTRGEPDGILNPARLPVPPLRPIGYSDY